VTAYVSDAGPDLVKGSPIAWPLVSVWLDDDDPMYGEGPWRVLHRAALRSGWRVEGLFSRGNTLTAAGGVGGLTDALSLRFHLERSGVIRRATALWTRTTWPTLGRVGAREADSDRTEGRKTTEGRTWLWHPPMSYPDGELVTFPKWSFDQGWTWSNRNRTVVRCGAADVKKWISWDEGN